MITPNQAERCAAAALPDGVVEAVLDLWMEGRAAHGVPVCGSSMFPVLKEGDVVRVIHEVDHLGLGDIVVFRMSGELVAHRVVRRFRANGGGRLYLTQGDRCRCPDPPVSEDEIVGRVVGISRGERYLAIDGRHRRWIHWARAIMLRLKAYRPRLGWVLGSWTSGHGTWR